MVQEKLRVIMDYDGMTTVIDEICGRPEWSGNEKDAITYLKKILKRMTR